MLEKKTSEQRKLAPEMDCTLGVSSLTWPENKWKRGKQGNENQPLLCNAVDESTLHRGCQLLLLWYLRKVEVRNWGGWDRPENDGLTPTVAPKWQQVSICNHSPRALYHRTVTVLSLLNLQNLTFPTQGCRCLFSLCKSLYWRKSLFLNQDQTS